MKSHGDIEAAVSAGLYRFERQHMGREPRAVDAHLIQDLLVIRLRGVLTASEQQLARSLPSGKGRDLLKQVRRHLIETARPLLEVLIQDITGVPMLSLHYDLSTVTGEEVMLFTLASAPMGGEVKRK